MKNSKERAVQLSIIYLAAGSSRRFGGDKLTADFHGKPMYRAVLDRLCGILRADWEITVVTRSEQIRRECENLPVKTVISPDSEKGISYSVKAGITAAENAENYAFFVADQPYLTAETIKAFLETALKSDKKTACVISGGVTGNPAFFNCAYRGELMNLTGDRGGKRIIKEHSDDTEFFEASAEELRDIDTKDDLKNG